MLRAHSDAAVCFKPSIRIRHLLCAHGPSRAASLMLPLMLPFDAPLALPM